MRSEAVGVISVTAVVLLHDEVKMRFFYHSFVLGLSGIFNAALNIGQFVIAA